MESTKVSTQLNVERQQVEYNTTKDVFGVLTIAGAKFEPKERAPLDIVVVFDKSGSMGGEKIKTAVNTLEFVIKNLRECDRLALVLYDTDVTVSFPLTAMDAPGKDSSSRIVAAIRSGTSTNLSGGLLKGIELMRAREDHGKNRVSSVLLLTDGLANVGLEKDEEIVEAMRKDLDGLPDVSVYTFGFGSDHKAPLLKAISDAAKGMYYFVETPEHIPESFGDCLGGLLAVVAQNINVAVTVESGLIAKVHAKKGAVIADDKKSFTVQLGDLQSEEAKNIVFEVSVPAFLSHAESSPTGITSKVSCFNVISSSFDEIESHIVVSRPEQATLEAPNEIVEKQRKRILTAQAMADALALAEKNQLDDARVLVDSALDRLKLDDSAYSRELRDDLEMCKDGLSSSARYHAMGSHQMCSKTQTHMEERSNLGAHSRGFVSYCAPQKAAFKKQFK